MADIKKYIEKKKNELKNKGNIPGLKNIKEEWKTVSTHHKDSKYNSSLYNYLNDSMKNNELNNKLINTPLLDVKKKFSVCGKNKYVKNTFARQSNDNQQGNCISCEKTQYNNKKNYNKAVKSNSLLPHDIGDYNKMCHNNILVWYPAQLSKNPYKKQLDKPDWESDDMLIKWINERMYDSEIACNVTGDNCSHPSLVSNYSDIQCGEKSCNNLNDLKNEIIKVSGSPSITCKGIYNKPGFKEKIKNHDNNGVKNERQFEYKCKSDSSKTLKDIGYIIPEQYKLWEDQFLLKKHHETKEINLGDLGLKVNPPTPAFERCMNNIFSSSDITHDESMIDEISEIEDPVRLKPKHINYIKKKFLAFLSESNHDELKKCISKDLYPDESICSVKLAQQMATILGVIFKIIGIRFTKNSLSEPQNQPLLREMISIFGDLIPRVFNKFIILSESIEKSECRGVTDGTLNLRMLYNKLFKKSKNVVNFDLGIMDMINDATPQQFDRSTILMVLGIAFLKFF